MNEESLNLLRNAVTKIAYVSGAERYIESANGKKNLWLFDFRQVLLRPEVLNAYAELFFEKYKDQYPFQVCGLEVAAIPLVSAIVMKSVEKEMPVNGFFIRKSRKKTGLLNMIEGKVTSEKIILVDDLINSGSSFIRQIEVLERLKNEEKQGGAIHSVFSILRFRDLSYYTYFSDKKISVESFFDLNDFQNILPVANLVDREEKPIPNPFTSVWYWSEPKSEFQYVVPKSAPTFYEGKLYVGTDSGKCVCLDSTSGKKIWEYQIPINDKKKIQFSTPSISGGNVYFGGHDGNVYALDAKSGKRKWVFLDADWIESSPCIVEETQTLFITLEYGLFRKNSSLVAIDANSGTQKWKINLEGVTKSSPVYSKKHAMIYCGSENKIMYAVDAKTGKIVWKLETSLSIISAAYVDEEHRALVFGGLNANSADNDTSTIYVCDLKTGEIRVTYSDLQFGIYSTPVVVDDIVIVASLDKNIHAFDIHTGLSKWKVHTGSRIFATPVIIEGGQVKLYVGANNSILYEVNPQTGEISGMSHVTERITSKIAFDEKSGMIFLPTYANEIYALQQKSKSE